MPQIATVSQACFYAISISRTSYVRKSGGWNLCKHNPRIFKSIMITLSILLTFYVNYNVNSEKLIQYSVPGMMQKLIAMLLN